LFDRPVTCTIDSISSLAGRQDKPGIERVQTLADISRSALCYHSNETRASIANPPNSAELEVTPIILSSYIRVRAVVWECGEGQRDRHTDGHDYYTFRLGYASMRNVTNWTKNIVVTENNLTNENHRFNSNNRFITTYRE